MAIQDEINSFTSSCGAEELLRLSAETYKCTTNRVVSVASVNDLPDLINQTIDPGTIIYVDGINTPVVAHAGCWAGLDNRELRNDYLVGQAWAWGYNITGQLGNNSTVSSRSPVSVVDNITNWCRVSAGVRHNLGVGNNGTLWAWGCNTSGQLGDGTTVSKSAPVS